MKYLLSGVLYWDSVKLKEALQAQYRWAKRIEGPIQQIDREIFELYWDTTLDPVAIVEFDDSPCGWKRVRSVSYLKNTSEPAVQREATTARERRVLHTRSYA